MENVVGDVVVAAGCIAYSGPFTPAFRQLLQQEWTALLKAASVPHTPDTNLIDTLQVKHATLCSLTAVRDTVTGFNQFGGVLACINKPSYCGIEKARQPAGPLSMVAAAFTSQMLFTQSAKVESLLSGPFVCVKCVMLHCRSHKRRVSGTWRGCPATPHL